MDRSLRRNDHDPGVPAKLVDLAPELDPVPAVIVSDKRNLLGRRLSILAVALLLLFFSISGYIQSANNGNLLHRAAVDRSLLISIIHAQSGDIQRLQKAFSKQNKELKKAGFKVVVLPPVSQTEQPTPAPETTTNPKSSRTPTPHSSPTAHPHPSHSPRPPPSQTPLSKAEQRVCNLTGICLLAVPMFYIF